ncbi:hypothetical protein BH11PSE12_BH11PSE12_24860 [soil metagenome]
MFYFVLAFIAIFLSKQPGNIATLWLPNAIAVACMLHQNLRRAVGILAGVMSANFLVNIVYGESIVGSLMYLPANAAEIVFSVYLIHITRVDQHFDDNPEKLAKFIAIACCLPPLVGATIGAGLLSLQQMVPFGRVWPSWYVGSTIGTAVVLPLALLILRRGSLAFLRSIDWLPLGAFFLLTIAVDITALLYLPFPFIYLLIPLTLATFYLNFQSVVTLISCSTLVVETVISLGYFAAPPMTSHWQVLLLYLPVFLTFMPPMLLAASVNHAQTKELSRHNVEEQLKRSKDEIQHIIDHMPAMIGYWDTDLKNRFGNKAYLEWFGIGPEALKGMHIRDVIGEEKFALNLPFIHAALNGKTQMFERTIVDMQGLKKHSLASYIPDFFEGKVLGYYAFVTDITPLKEAQEAESRAQAKLQSIFEAATEFSMIATDTNGLITLFSLGAERMLGYSADEMLHKQTPAILHLEEEAIARGAVLTAELGYPVTGFNVFVEKARLGKSESGQWTYVAKSGRHIPVNLVVTSIRSATGDIEGFLGVATDISRQNQLQASLISAKELAETATRAKSEFLANMSHEIRTPLNAVLGISLLLSRTELSAEQRRYLEMIRTSGQSLLSILNDILDFSKIEAGRLELVSQPFFLNDILGELANIMSVNVGEKSLELAIGIESDVPGELIGDALRLQQVLVNLVGNAIKFTETGEVSVLVNQLSRSGDEVQIQFVIRDTGIGMSAAQVDKLFSPFSQADASTTRRFGGTGLGLVICRRLLEMMGGSVEVRSVLGQGSEFLVQVPMRIANASERNVIKPADVRHLLIVDDNPTSRDYICKTVLGWGWQADRAASGQIAIEKILSRQDAGNPYHAVLIDWHMPALDGLETLRLIRQKYTVQAPPAIIMTTAFERSKFIIEDELSRPDALLIKPVTGSSLFNAFHEALSTDNDYSAAISRGKDVSVCYRIDGAHILLVEDNKLNQIVATGILEQAGASTEIANNGEEAIELLRINAQRFGLVLMDIQMPVMDGISATRIIRGELGLTLPIIAMTAGVMNFERDQCFASGMNDIIGKPIDMEQMFSTLRRYLPENKQPIATPVPAQEQRTQNTHNSHNSVILSEVRSDAPSASTVFDPSKIISSAKGNVVHLKTLVGVIRNVAMTAVLEFNKARSLWSQNEGVEAARILHTLRGTVGLLGARQFVDAALQLEMAIHDRQISQIDALFEVAGNALVATTFAVDSWLKEQDVTALALSEAKVVELDRSALATFKELLEKKNMRACDSYQALRPGLMTYLSAQEQALLGNAIEQLDFSAALEILNRQKR